MGITHEVETFCKNCHRCDVAKLPPSIPLQVSERVRRRVHHAGRAKIQDETNSDEVCFVVQAPKMSGVSYKKSDKR